MSELEAQMLHDLADEARDEGLYAKLIPGSGWVTCDVSDPDAQPDINSLIVQKGYDIDELYDQAFKAVN